MKIYHGFAIGCVIVACCLAFKDSSPLPSPAPVPAMPSAELQALVAPLKEWRGKPHADEVAEFYAVFAEVVQANNSEVKTYGQLRAANVRSIKLETQAAPDLKSLPGLGDAIDKVLVASFGVEDKPIDRPKVVATLNAVAWALGGK